MGDMEQPVLVHPGMFVYIPDDKEIWLKAQVLDTENNICTLIVCRTEEIRKCKLDAYLPSSEQSIKEVHNLTELSPINQASVMCCLHERYTQHTFYTNAGSTVVAINPFQNIQALYTVDTALQYQEGSKTEPHIYKIGCQVYKRLCHGFGETNQCIIVSGESGSGKTVSAKHLLRYMTLVSNSVCDNRSHSTKMSRGFGHCVEQRILDSNPILEAFGNAVTQRNDNSSRFGKFTQLQFSRNGQMVGAQIQTYLLEKTRVVHQSNGEGNFHIFYQMMNSLQDSTDPMMHSMLQKMGEISFKWIPVGKSIQTNRNLVETQTAMTEIGLSQDIQNDVMKILLAILFLGNIEITSIEDEICKLVQDSVTGDYLKQSADLLGLAALDIEQVLLYRNIESGAKSRRSVFIKPVAQQEAYSRRDCLATLLYSRLFEWLVGFINDQIKVDYYDHTIGLLDIYGFEVFDNNSLEQLCINYANEKLQQHYIRHFLKDLQREYEEECISWHHLDYHDNQACLDLLEGQSSVFGLLNEDVQLNRKTNPEQLCERILQLSKTSTCVKKPRTFLKPTGFTIHHYAGDVTYMGQELSNKNRDNIPQEIVSLLQSSSITFVSDLFENYTIEDTSGRKKKTVLGKFKASLDALMSTLDVCNVHYIRCIKPNMNSVPQVFDQSYVMPQLIASGIIETVKISSLGYTIRLPYTMFLHRYGKLIRNSPSPVQLTAHQSSMTDNVEIHGHLDVQYQQHSNVCDSPHKTCTPKKRLRRREGLTSTEHSKSCCAAVLSIQFRQTEGLAQQFGKTKLFLHQYQIDILEKTRFDILSAKASIIQNVWRSHQRKLKLRQLRLQEVAAGKIQKTWKAYLRNKHVAAALLIQKAFRMHCARIKLQQKAREEKNKQQLSWKPIIDRKRMLPGVERSRSCEECQTSDVSVSKSLPDLYENNSINYCLKIDTELVTSSPMNIKKEDKVRETEEDKSMETEHVKSVSKVSENSNLDKENVIQPTKLLHRGRPNMLKCSPRKSSRPSSKLIFKRGEHNVIAIARTSSGDDNNDGASPVKKRRKDDILKTVLEDLTIGDGIVSTRRLPRVPIKFHTRPSVLKNAHYVNQREFECGLQDCLPDSQSKMASKYFNFSKF